MDHTQTIQQQTPLEKIIEQIQLRLNKAFFQYEVAQFNYDYALSQLDIYKDLYFKAKDRLDYITGGN